MIAKIKDNIVAKTSLIILFLFSASNYSFAQIEYRWLAAGSFHNFYSNMGSEIEEGFIVEQQAGWQWPAIYAGQDAQAFKGMWLGVENFPNPAGGADMPHRVVHVGPRVNGLAEFIPIEMETISKRSKPEVFVYNNLSEKRETIIDEIDPTLKGDRVIYTKINTILGIQIERTIRQFSQQYHDNYHIIEYVFTNTGNTDDDAEIELPDLTIEGFRPFFVYRMAPVAASRYTIGNGTGWGINTMYDRRGDGLRPGEPEQFRAQFAWHGYFLPFTDYNNIGGPIWDPAPADIANGFLSEDDTTGRLAAYHFVGSATVHADASASDETDDPGQPSTMSEEESDYLLFNPNSDAFNTTRMSDEYALMSRGRTAPRHAYQVEPTGYPGFIDPTGDPALGTGGGYSYFNSYGPYDLAPGEDIKIVVVEASAGISREVAEETGRAYKNGNITAVEKNEVVFQSRDSLFQTFERAIANYKSGYSIPRSPEPPSKFEIISSDNGVLLSWEYDASESELGGFEIYRAHTRVDSAYHLIYKANANERSIFDNDDSRSINPDKFHFEAPEVGEDYYYYIVSVSKDVNTNNTGKTPTGSKLQSNRYYTQSYDYMSPFRGTSIEEKVQRASKIQLFQNYPNPFNPSTTISYYLPSSSELEIAVYNLMGQKVAVLLTGRKPEGMHEITWNAENIASGVYFYRLKTNEIEMTKQFILLK